MPRGGARQGAGRPKGQSRYGEMTRPIRVPESLVTQIVRFIEHRQSAALPFYGTKVPAGFPSPADDHIEKSLDLNEHLIPHPAATFFVRASGHSMINAGIHDQDILIVDRSLEPSSGKIVVVAVNGELTVKRLIKKNQHLYLQPENPDFPTLEIKAGHDIHVWGVVTTVIHAV